MSPARREGPLARIAAGVVVAALTGCAGSSGHGGTRAADAGGDGFYRLPPVNDAGLGDSTDSRDRVKFACGSVSGALTGGLVCDRLFPDLNWDSVPGYAEVSVSATLAPGATGPDSGLARANELGVTFRIYTGPSMAPMTESCATVPPLPPRTGGGFIATVGDWEAYCNPGEAPTPGVAFQLTITSVGVLTSDSLGADPIDASADAFAWDAAHPEVLSNTFHGALQATVPTTADGGAPVFVTMTF